MRRWLEGPRLALLLGVAAAGFLTPLVLSPGAFAFSPGAAYSDVLTAHLSSAWFLRRAIAEYAQIPLWNPTILGGLPFAADPLSGLWYPPFWLMAAAPGPQVANFLFWAHLVLAGLGMYRLARAEGLRGEAAWAGALAFSGMPKLIGHVGLGHLGLVAAVSWTPWVLTLAARAARSTGALASRSALVAGIAIGVAFLADPRWLPPLALTGLAYFSARFVAARADREGRRRGEWIRGVAAFAVGGVTVAGGMAVPLAELTRLTTRATIAPEAASALALPPERLLGLFVAGRGGWAEWIITIGTVGLILAVVGATSFWPRAGHWLVLFAVATVLSLGSATPIGRLASEIPGLGLLRVPARWLFLSGFALAALVAWGIEHLHAPPSPQAGRRGRLSALAAALLCISLSVAVAASGGDEMAAPVTAVFAALALAAILAPGGALRSGGAALVLTLLLFIELVWIDVSLIEPRPADASLAAGRETARALSERPVGSRTFSPSYSLPQEAAAEAGFEITDGVHPLSLRRFVAHMARATGFSDDRYSVTLPPFPEGDPREDWGPRIDADALGLLAVSRVVSSYPVAAEGLREVRGAAGRYIYENLAARPRAWLEQTTDGAQGWIAAEITRWTPNQIEVLATGPGTLVLSEVAYPGWVAEIDGRPVEVETRYDLLRSVQLMPGEHRVVFRFLPGSLLAGAVLSLLGGGMAITLWRRW